MTFAEGDVFGLVLFLGFVAVEGAVVEGVIELMSFFLEVEVSFAE